MRKVSTTSWQEGEELWSQDVYWTGTGLVGVGEVRKKPVKRPLVEKAKEYVTAEASKVIEGPTPARHVELRRMACATCEKNVGGHCQGCDCPKWTRSKLETKWTMPRAKCPLGLWPVLPKGGATTKTRSHPETSSE